MTKEENRGARVQEVVDLWKQELKLAKINSNNIQTKSTQQIVEELLNDKLITQDEKDKILGNELKGIQAEYNITIGSKTIDFYTSEYRNETPGLYITKTNILLKTWDELIDEGYITVSDNIITACQKNREGDLVIAEGIVGINNSAFSGYSTLKDVTYPKTLKNIDRNAFEGCRGLTNFTITDSIENIGMLAFKNCTGLKEIRVQNSNFTIDTRK